MKKRVMKSKLFYFIAFCLLLASLIFVWLMRPTPITYFLAEPPSPQARTMLQKKLQDQLAILEKEEARLSYDTGSNDADRLWPKDRTKLVLAIQEYIIQKAQMPDSYSALESAGLIQENSLENRYKISSTTNTWKILTIKDYLIAEGN